MKPVFLLTVATVAPVFLAAITHASAQGATIHERTYLSFKAPVQVPGATLPAGKYLFRLADSDPHHVTQVLDPGGKHLISQFFFIATPPRTIQDVNVANGKPVVTFLESPQGVASGVKYFYSPSDLQGKEFVYPKEQALQLASATHQPVLATDTEVGNGAEAHVFTVRP